MNKRLSIIGRGTVGCMSAIKFHNLGYKIDWYHDPNTPPLSVGEGTTLQIPRFMSDELGLNYNDLDLFDAHYKQGIEKINWTKKPFTHYFPLGSIALHFNANKFQEYVIDKLKDKVNIIEQRVKHNDVNNYIIDCSGTPSKEKEILNTPIPVNKARIIQCLWDKPKFNYTLCIAKKWGWVFLIPLKNRCSVGYLYNELYSDFDEIESELQDILKKYNLVATHGNTLDFKNYYREKNYTDKVSYNGNASSFLEPLEATSLYTAYRNIDKTNKVILGEIDYNSANKDYRNMMEETIDIIMLHYLVKPPYKTEFWEMAHYNAVSWFVDRFESYPKIRLISGKGPLSYSAWKKDSFKQNIKGLKLHNKLKELNG